MFIGIYIIGILMAFSILVHSCVKGKAGFWEAAFAPILMLLSWVYVIIAIINFIDKRK